MRMTLWALAPIAAVLLAGCGDGAGKTASGRGAAENAGPSNKTLAATVKDGGGALAGVVDNAGLGTVLEGVGPYTLFAPSDGALKAGGDFADPAMKAQSVALLRAHVAPGAITRADMASAIDKAGAKGVQMRTMAGDLLTFSKDGDTIVVTAPDGAAARLSGKESLVKNGVVQPLDGLLIKAGATAG